MFDTHCHLTFPQLYQRLEEVIDAAAAAGVDRMITVGTTADDVETARQIAAVRDNVWFTAGIHPHYADACGDERLAALAEAAADGRCAAFGEMGLDYHYDEPPPDRQRAMFEAQLELVRRSPLDKPIVIHCRKAVEDTLAMIRTSTIPGQRFVFHCFTEPADDCRKVLDAGAMVSFTGIVTYRNAPEVRASATIVPADRIMVETDAPYLTPEPHRKVKPNEPRYVADTARFLAELRGVEPTDFIARCDANAARFFAV